MKKSYYEERDLSCIRRTDEIVETLPYYVQDFFVGVEPRTSSLSRLNYAYDLRIFYTFLTSKVFKDKKIQEISLDDLAKLEASDFEYFLSFLSRYELNGKFCRCTETGKARKLSTLRAFYKYYFNKNQLPANTPSKVSMPKIHEKEIIRLETNEKVDEIGDILYVVKNGDGLTKKQKAFHNSTMLRDTAIITLFLGTGIRISELVGLNLDDFDFKNNSFVVTRKGGNRAVLYYNNQVLQALTDYYNQRTNDKKVPDGENAFFLSLQYKRISTRTVQDLVKKYARIISPLKKISPHKLRSTFGTNLYRQTNDIYVVADCLGHKDVNTTKRHYAAITEDIRKKAGLGLTISPDNNN
ncbi:MAG: tyrosine-type recombinase/integrase [Clostridia bacterium]|nr:tyrosine-type recombinase/integrase [Clostridia bacterium]